MVASTARKSAPASVAPVTNLTEVAAEKGLRTAVKGLLGAETKATQARQNVASAIIALYAATGDYSGKAARKTIRAIQDEMFAVTKDTTPFEAEALKKAQETFRKASQYHVRRMLDDLLTAEQLAEAGYKYDSRLPVDQKLPKPEAETTAANQDGDGTDNRTETVISLKQDPHAALLAVNEVLNQLVGEVLPASVPLAARAEAIKQAIGAIRAIEANWRKVPYEAATA